MGMFDDIIVPKSYLKGLLTKDQEKIIKGNLYQTKCLDRTLRMHKVYKQKLYTQDPPPIKTEKRKWKAVDYTGEVYFYDNIKDEKGNIHWVEFRFVFLKGKVDAKYVEEFRLQQTSEEILKQNEEWESSKEKQDKYKTTLKYKIYFSLFKVLHKLLNKVRKKVTPYAYEYGTARPDEISN
jgi:hypothetical protein